jgi:hypothetical protein
VIFTWFPPRKIKAGGQRRIPAGELEKNGSDQESSGDHQQ